jgi:hypothetical protein
VRKRRPPRQIRNLGAPDYGTANRKDARSELVSERVVEDNGMLPPARPRSERVACVDCWIEDFRKDMTRCRRSFCTAMPIASCRRTPPRGGVQPVGITGGCAGRRRLIVAEYLSPREKVDALSNRVLTGRSDANPLALTSKASDHQGRPNVVRTRPNPPHHAAEGRGRAPGPLVRPRTY